MKTEGPLNFEIQNLASPEWNTEYMFINMSNQHE